MVKNFAPIIEFSHIWSVHDIEFLGARAPLGIGHVCLSVCRQDASELKNLTKSCQIAPDTHI